MDNNRNNWDSCLCQVSWAWIWARERGRGYNIDFFFSYILFRKTRELNFNTDLVWEKRRRANIDFHKSYQQEESYYVIVHACLTDLINEKLPINANKLYIFHFHILRHLNWDICALVCWRDQHFGRQTCGFMVSSFYVLT